MENIRGLFIVYIVALILIMGMALGIWLLLPLSASTVFGTAWIGHFAFMAWALWDHLRESAQ